MKNERPMPLFPDIGIIAMVPDQWSAPWQTRHYLLRELSAYFHVVWCNPVPEWRNAKLDSRFRPWSRSQKQSESMIEHTANSLFPRLYRPDALASFFERSRINAAKSSLGTIGIRKWILYLWLPDFAPSLGATSYDLTVYHIDDEYSFASDDPPIDPIEADLLSNVDQVIIHSRTLMEKKGKLNPNTIRVPNGVNYEAYSQPRPEPADLKDIPHPRMGYVGYIKTHIDLGLHIALAQARPDWHFVFVGPVGALEGDADKAETLFGLKNVHYLGGKPPSELPGYSQHFDVCLMGYKVDNYTKYIYPLKMHEYLATGNPVVGSPIPAIMEFADIIETADTIEGWLAALERGLSAQAKSPEGRALRQAAAKAHDWQVLASNVAGLFCRRLGSDYKDRWDRLKG
jgi:glycosyltransferase involved in cell wall biosynthesis